MLILGLLERRGCSLSNEPVGAEGREGLAHKHMVYSSQGQGSDAEDRRGLLTAGGHR